MLQPRPGRLGTHFFFTGRDIFLGGGVEARLCFGSWEVSEFWTEASALGVRLVYHSISLISFPSRRIRI
jgi:hypothetical protein